jgi:flagellar basal-body rod protein FlgB
VANAETPGYRRLEVDFEAELDRQTSSARLGGETTLKTTVRESDNVARRPDGNNVDIDKEMGLLSKNALLYQTYAQVLASKLAMMRSAITGQ